MATHIPELSDEEITRLIDGKTRDELALIDIDTFEAICRSLAADPIAVGDLRRARRRGRPSRLSPPRR